MSRVSRTRMSLVVSRNGLAYSPIADFTDITSYINIFCTPVQCAIDPSFKVNNNMPYLVCWTSTSSGQRNTQWGHQLNHHPLQLRYVAMTRLLDRDMSLHESCLHVGMKVRQRLHITEVIPIVHSGNGHKWKTSVQASSMTGYKAGSCQTGWIVQTTAWQWTITWSFLLNCAPVCQPRGFSGSVLGSVDFTCSWGAFPIYCRCKTQAVT